MSFRSLNEIKNLCNTPKYRRQKILFRNNLWFTAILISCVGYIIIQKNNRYQKTMQEKFLRKDVFAQIFHYFCSVYDLGMIPNLLKIYACNHSLKFESNHLL